MLILPKEIGKVHLFKGADGKDHKIEIPDEYRDREQFAQMEGELIAVSPLAFTYANSDEWSGHDKPKPGDRVLFAKYSGAKVTGKDGQEYRLTKDKDIAAVLS